MADANVLNRFEQATLNGDNPLVLDGTVQIGATGSLEIEGSLDIGATGTLTIDGSLDATSGSTSTFDGAMVTSAGGNLKTKIVTLPVGDLQTMASVWVAPGIAGTIVRINSVIDTALTGSDAGLNFEIGGTEITDSVITIPQSSSAPGDVDQSFPTALNVITATDAIEVLIDGLTSTASLAVVTFEIELS